jgi:hypothetical protein
MNTLTARTHIMGAPVSTGFVKGKIAEASARKAALALLAEFAA